MSEDTKEKYLKIALVVVGVIFWLIYPLSLIWPSGWIWHGGQGAYYLQMICGIYAVLGIYLIAAARNPGENRSLISFTIWSTVVHAAIMGRRRFPTVGSTAISLAMFQPCSQSRPSCGCSLQRGNGSSGRPPKTRATLSLLRHPCRPSLIVNDQYFQHYLGRTT
jgi:Family of unknown function (DUF6632)